MKYVRTWYQWTFWSFGVWKYGTTRSTNFQLSIGPFRFEFERALTDLAAPQNYGALGGSWQGKKKREKVTG
jgi:hypothetical protein